MIDILKAKKAFKEYISNYDITEPRINIKVIHMYHVAENSRKIAESLGLSKEEQNLAELIGLLHDLGRFEQVKWYHTFSDKNSIDHGQKSVEVLFADNWIQKFVEESNYNAVIYKAINNHNKFEIERGLSEYEVLHCKIVRDADNVDIYRAALDENQRIEDFGLIGCEDLSKEILSPEFFEDFKKEKLLLYSKAKTDMDIMVAIIAHIYALNFKESLEIIKENDYINRFIKRINCQDEYTRRKMEEIAVIAMNYIDKKIEGKNGNE